MHKYALWVQTSRNECHVLRFVGADKQEGMPCSAMCSKCMGNGYSNTPHAEDDCVSGEDEL